MNLIMTRSLENDQSDEACGGLVVNFKGSPCVSIVSKVFSCFVNFQLSVTIFVIKDVFCFAMFACVVLHITVSLRFTPQCWLCIF